MPDTEITERQLLDRFLEDLRELPGVHMNWTTEQPDGSGQRYDARVDLSVGGMTVTLLAEVKKNLYPRDVRQAVWLFRESASKWLQSAPGSKVAPFLVAQTISPGAKDLLREERVGYHDSGGSLFLPADNIYLYVDKPPPKSLTRSIRSLFSGRRSQVLHAFLARPGEWFGVKETAERAQVSPATASQVSRELEKFDWMVSSGRGPAKKRRLKEPGTLLDAWTKQLAAMRPPVMRRYFVPSVRAEALVERFAQVCAQNKAEYAITHAAAGQRYAPFLSTVSQIRCRLLAGAAANRTLDALDARAVTQGMNLTVIETRSPGDLLFREFVNGVWLANPVQVYLDLMCDEGRNGEMAKHLRQEKIGY